MSKADVLSWKNVNLKHTPTDKAILKDLNGSVKTGELLCIMGQSGAGKSSLLSILTGRITSKTKNFSLTGDITMNGNNYDGYSFGQFAGYVRQDDYLLSTLTV